MKNVHGVKISGYGHEELANDLEKYCSWSPIAFRHVSEAGQNNAKIEVQREGKICYADDNIVKISRDSCLDKLTGLISPIYMAESVLFELKNAVNSRKYKDLNRQVKAIINGISLLKYGIEKSYVEFEATEKVSSILREIKKIGKPISPWGQKQIEEGDKGKLYFTNQPHDPNGSSPEFKLPTKFFYVYLHLRDVVKETKNMKAEILNLAKILDKSRPGNNKLDNFRLGSEMLQPWHILTGGDPVIFFVCYINALIWINNGIEYSVQWTGLMTDWKLCAMNFVDVAHVKLDSNIIKRIKEGI